MDWSSVNWERWAETAWTHGVRVLVVAAAIFIVLTSGLGSADGLVVRMDAA